MAGVTGSNGGREMLVNDDQTKLTTTEARGGSGGTSVRSLMVVSVVLVIVAFVAIYLYYR